MPFLDIFNNDAFSLASLTASMNEMPFKPSRIGSLGLFVESGINTTTAVVESRGGELMLLPTTQRGAPAAQASGTKRQMRSFVIPHIPYDATILADEIRNVRTFGSENELEGVQNVVNQRLELMNSNHEVTLEHLRIGAIKGQILDADGSTVIYDLFTEFGVKQQTEAFKLSDTAADVRALCVKARRKVEAALGSHPYSGLRAFCGADFYDALTGHDAVKDAYRRYEDSAMLRDDLKGGFRFGDIQWEEYRGQVGDIPFIAADEAYIVPEDAGIFQTWFAPADFVETVNTIGLPRYAKQKILDFDKGVQIHTQSNPLPICLKPRAVIKCTLS